jgi:peptide/nickel transport system substrate-binding protein
MERMSNQRDSQEQFRITRRGLVLSGAAAAALAAANPRFVNAAAVNPGQGRISRNADGATIVIGTLGEANTINPFLANDSESDFRCSMLFDHFVRLNPATYAPEPGIAASWTIDNLTFTFKLQPNAKFSDGSAVTADDVAFTIKGHIAKATGSVRQTKYTVIAGGQDYAEGKATDVSGIKVVDPQTLQITLAEPNAPFLLNLRYIYPVPKAALDGKDLAQDAFFQKPVGAGPFVFQKWDNGGDFVATKNANFWESGKPALDSFTHRVVADAQTIVSSVQSGDLDASNYPDPTAADQLKSDQDLAVLVPPFGSANGWIFNCRNEWLGKKEVRKAIAMALDTKQFAADSLLGLGQPGNGPLAPTNWAYDKDLAPIPFDVDGAKQLIAQSGMPAGTKFRFSVNAGNVLREDWLTYTQQALKEIGVEVDPIAGEYATLLTQTQNPPYDFDVCGIDIAGATVDPSDLYDQFHTGSPNNYAGYSNPDLDKLLEQGRAELDIEKAKVIWKQVQQILQDDVPMFFAWYRPFLHVVNKKYTGYVDSNLEGGLFERLQDWTIQG